MADTILYGNTGQAAILTNSIQGPSGSLASPTGTGYVHVTGGTVDGAAQAVNLAGGSTYVTGVLPMSNMASPTGTGVALVTAGVMNAAAGPVPLGGGASYVTGLLPVANVAPAGTNGYVLTTTGGVAVWSAATGITALTSDVTASGTGSVAATVVAVHGATVPAAGALTTGNVLQVTGTSALGYAAVNLAGGSNYVTGILPTANQASQSLSGDATGTTAAVVVTQAQAGTFSFGSSTGTITTSYAATSTGLAQTSTSAATANNMVLSPQASTATNGTPGSLVISLAQPTGTGSEAYAVVQRNGYPLTHVGYYAGYGGLWLHSGTGPEAPGVTNYTLLSNSSSLYINATNSAGSIYLGTNGALYAGYSSGGMQLGAAALSAGGGSGGVLGLTNGSSAVIQTSVPTSGSVIQSYGGNLNLYAANAVAGNNAPGSVIAYVGSPTGTGDSGSFSVINANYSPTVPVFEARPLYGTPSYAALYLGVVPNSSNASFYGTSSFTYMSNSSVVGLLLASAYFALYASSSTSETVVGSNYNFALAGASATTGEYGGGQRVLSIGKAVTNPTTALTTSSVIYSDHTSGAISLYPLGVTKPVLSVGTNPTTNGGAGVLILNPATTNPSANLTNQGVIYLDSTSGGICLYPSSVSGCVLNANTNGVYMVDSATIQAGLSCTGGLGGIGPSPPIAGFVTAPFSWAQTTAAISFGTGGTVVVSAAQAATPGLTLTSGVLAASAILDFTTWGTTGFWVIDASGVGAGTYPLSFKNGTKTVSLSTLPVGGLVLVRTWGANNIAVN